MTNTRPNILIVLAHIDDEYAIAPLLWYLAQINLIYHLKIIYCAERLDGDEKRRFLRRKENGTALKSLGLNPNQVIFLNDYFSINDRYLYKEARSIYKYLSEMVKTYNVTKVFTLSFEGGHPDHDALAMIVDKVCKQNCLDSFYFPAYNSRRTFFLSLSVCTPLKQQEKFTNYIILKRFAWIRALRLAFIYKSEVNAFTKLLPFLFYKFIFSNKIYLMNELQVESVDWNKSHSLKRFNVSLDVLIMYLEKI
tara:strand:+ start:2898 stop:3650 length:753 start_codon:yes stop_codon:yes gene_type:complete